MHPEKSNIEEEKYFEYIKSMYCVDESYYNQHLIADLPAGSKILDVGCGLGLLLKVLNKRIDSCELYGVDINQKLLDEAVKNCPGARLIKANGEILPFIDNYFDIVFSLDLIEHLDSPEGHLTEIRRLLKPEGKLIICTPDRFAYYPNIYPAKNSCSAIFHNILRMAGLRTLEYTHKREYTVFGFRGLLKKMGFQVITPNGLERIRKYPNHPFLARARNFQLICKRVLPFNKYGSMIYLVEKTPKEL